MLDKRKTKAEIYKIIAESNRPMTEISLSNSLSSKGVALTPSSVKGLMRDMAGEAGYIERGIRSWTTTRMSGSRCIRRRYIEIGNVVVPQVSLRCGDPAGLHS